MTNKPTRRDFLGTMAGTAAFSVFPLEEEKPELILHSGNIVTVNAREPRAQAVAIVRRTVPGATDALIERAAQFVGAARDLDLDKPPGIAETIDWVAALVALGVGDLVDPAALGTLGALAKTPDDSGVLHDALLELRGSAL